MSLDPPACHVQTLWMLTEIGVDNEYLAMGADDERSAVRLMTRCRPADTAPLRGDMITTLTHSTWASRNATFNGFYSENVVRPHLD